MKRMLIVNALVLCSLCSTKAQTLFSCDFGNGIPETFTLTDGDGLTPSSSMAKAGFAIGVPWIAATAKGETDMAASSTSWYTPAGTSDDWLITPSIAISIADAQLTWRAKASDASHRDGYVVCCLAGNRCDTLLAIGAEDPAWTFHRLDLSSYFGQAVQIAFVNNSTDCSQLFVDDIVVASKSDLICTVDLPEQTPHWRTLAVGGEVYNVGDEPIDGFDVTLSYGDSIISNHYDMQLQPGEKRAYLLDSPIAIAEHETLAYIVVARSGQHESRTERSITSYARRVLVEELTGTWCAWCVRGIVGMKLLRDEASDWTVGIAVHNSDVMTLDSGLDTWVSSLVGGTGLPYAAYNRRFGGDPSPGVIEGYCHTQFDAEPVMVSIDAESTIDTIAGSISVQSILHFAESSDNADYRLAYCVIENDVHQPGNRKYNQNNSAYSGYQNGIMGGYEDMPSTIAAADMWYQEVARGYGGEFCGVEGSVPASYVAGQPISHDYQFPLPGNILVYDNVELVVMLVDQRYQHVANARIVKPVPAGGEMGIEDVRHQAGRHVQSGNVPEYYDLQGRRLSNARDTGPALIIVRQADGTTSKILNAGYK